MAATSLGARLTEQHRQAQVANQQSFLAEYLALWPLLNPFDLDASAPGWVQAVLRLIEVFRDQSAELTVDYYRRYREVEAPDAPELPPIEVATPAETVRAIRRVARGNRGMSRQRDNVIRLDWRAAERAARTSMIVTGPVNIKAKVKARPSQVAARDRDPLAEGSERRSVDDASRAALVESSGAAMRHVIEGSRKTTLTVVQNDDMALGWARVTDANPCYFCAMLAGRGGVYKTRRTASFEPHDHCACTAEPIFDRRAEWPGRAREFQQLWQREIAGRYSGQDAVRAWRRFYEKQNREARRAAEAA